jgi:hypothetical protein
VASKGGSVTAVEVLDFIVHGVVLVTTLVAMRLWWQTRSTAAAWMSATFLVFSAVILTGYLDLDGYIVRMQLLALMAGPYFLFRFAAAISGRHATLRRIVNGAFGLVVVLTLGLPTFPDLEAGPSDPVGFAYLVLLLTVWGGCGLLAAGCCCRGLAGRGAWCGLGCEPSRWPRPRWRCSSRRCRRRPMTPPSPTSRHRS